MILRHPTLMTQLLRRASSAAASSFLPTTTITTITSKTIPAMHHHHHHRLLKSSLRHPPTACFSTLLSRPSRRTSSVLNPYSHPPSVATHQRLPLPLPSHTRSLATPSPTSQHTPDADTLMDTLQELYATAKDEFEIAAEETEARTVYAADDRAAANEALEALRSAYQDAVRKASPAVAREVTARVGARIRELEGAVRAMEERALEG